MHSGLEHLLAEGIISELLGRLQSGKEAEVFVVRCQGKVVAAKVYKDRAHRSFKNNSSYKEGRTVKNSRSERAMERGSKFGKAAAEDAWKAAEVNALYTLHAAQVRVPTPVMFFEGVLLMELVLDADGNTAPRLIDVTLTPEQANVAYYDMLTQLVRMLNCELIHGDLSPYNVLWAAAGPTVIDFPQIISASHNSGSERFFLRDAENILGHFARIDRSLAVRRGDASEIWQAYLHRELTPDFRPSGRARPAPRLPASPPRRPVEAPRSQDWSRSRGNERPPKQAPPRAAGDGAPRPPGTRTFNNHRQAPAAPEVLLARPRRPGVDSFVPTRPSAQPWPSSAARQPLQVSARPSPHPAPAANGRLRAPQSPPRVERASGANGDSDGSGHRRRRRRRS
jgi:RIO kinase 1